MYFQEAATPNNQHAELPPRTLGAAAIFANFFKTSCEGSYLRIAYKVRIIPARQNPSKNLSVLNIVTFTDSATVSPKIRMKMMEHSSTGLRPTLYTEGKGQETLLSRAVMLDAETHSPVGVQQMLSEYRTIHLHIIQTHFGRSRDRKALRGNVAQPSLFCR